MNSASRALCAAAMRRHVRTVAKVRLLDWDPEDDR
jgi:GntR family transcriptional repressor for pyruvate dehydrogenase complex